MRAREIWIENLVDESCLRNLLSREHDSRALRYLLGLMYRECLVALNSTHVKLWKHNVHGRIVWAWNSLVVLRDSYTKSELEQEYLKLQSAGLFELDVVDDRSCLPRTADSMYNPDMSQRFWVTDTCFGGLLQREVNPAAWSKALTTIAAFHLNKSNLDAIIQTIRDPQWYRCGNWRNGVAHIFILKDIHGESPFEARWENGYVVPDSLQEDPVWANRKRLESQALTLLRIVETILAGSVADHPSPAIRRESKKWGLNWTSLEETHKKILLEAIKVISSYLLAVQWNGYEYDMRAPTVSSWEEAPFEGGCTTDVSFMVDAFKLMHRLFFDPRYEDASAIKELREDFSSEDIGYVNDDFYRLLSSHSYADFRIEDNIKKFIEQGAYFIACRVTAPVSKAEDVMCRSSVQGLMQSESRSIDMSLTLLSYYSSFDENPAKHANTLCVVIREVLKSLSHADKSRVLGLRRYSLYEASHDGITYYLMDSYLGLRFVLGLVAPELCRHQYAAIISEEWRRISPFMEERSRLGTASPRERIIELGHQRFHSPDLQNVASPKKDATTAHALSWRQQFQLPEWSACWTIGITASLVGLAEAKSALLTHVSRVGWNSALSLTYSEIQELLDEVTTICLKTIVAKTDQEGRSILRADGSTLPNDLNVMEAFQTVIGEDGVIRTAPGEHTLMWSMVQLERGLRLAIKAAAFEDQVTRLKGRSVLIN